MELTKSLSRSNGHSHLLLLQKANLAFTLPGTAFVMKYEPRMPERAVFDFRAWEAWVLVIT